MHSDLWGPTEPAALSVGNSAGVQAGAGGGGRRASFLRPRGRGIVRSAQAGHRRAQEPMVKALHPHGIGLRFAALTCHLASTSSTRAIAQELLASSICRRADKRYPCIFPQGACHHHVRCHSSARATNILVAPAAASSAATAAHAMDLLGRDDYEGTQRGKT